MIQKTLENLFSQKNLIGGLILFFGILILIVDSKISDFNNSLLVDQNYQNNLLINAIAHLSAFNQYQSYIVSNAPLELKNFEKNPSLNKSPELEKIFENFHQGLTERSTFLNYAGASPRGSERKR